MFYILESEGHLNGLRQYFEKETFIEVIPGNYNYHPKLTHTTAVFLKPEGSKGFIIPINHEEGLNVDKTRVYEVLKQFNKLYCIDRKNLLYHFNLHNSNDISLLYSMVEYDRIDLPGFTSTINYFYSKYDDKKDINNMIPLSKLYEYNQKLYSHIEKYLSYDKPKGFDFYNGTATNVFYLLEQAGLGIYYNSFNEVFKPVNPLYNSEDNKVLTYYNLYNATSRPTNAYNSVNFAAIPKSEKHRKCFKPQNDKFIEFDFDGYHLRLLCDEINFELNEDSAHKQVARLLFEKEEITDEEYSKAKEINFHALYGKIPKKHKNLEIFKKIQEYIDSLWSQYQGLGVVFNPISEKPFTENLKRMNPAKLMNYLMQSLETSRNILILKEVLRFLKDKKTNVCLYTYDSLLFDYSKEDGKELLSALENILSENGKYPVRFKYSNNLVL